MSLQAHLDATPGVTAGRDAATRGFVFNHTMLRVKDVEKSLDFYTRVLGFTLVRRRDFDEAKFSLYFLVLVDDSAPHLVAKVSVGCAATGSRGRVAPICRGRCGPPAAPSSPSASADNVADLPSGTGW